MPSVLIVDDESQVCELLERWLATAGYETRIAGTADAAIEAMNERPASVVLCDVHMPGRDGLWLTEQLRARYPSTAIVLATGLDEIPGSALRDGVVGCLLKPFQRSAMLDVVREGIEYHAATSLQHQ
jgi:DNA-binding NtrC family response regulator